MFRRTQDPPRGSSISYTGVSPSTPHFPKRFYYRFPIPFGVLLPRRACTSVWAGPTSLAATMGIIIYFLFLQVLRCFSSLRLPRSRVTAISCRVPPFGYLWITAYLQLPKAFRCSSRPSSAPSAKAFTVRPSLLNHNFCANLFSSRN